jgi:sigma-B regulation protein RsbU (phosphoserine phosphatase)
MLGSGAAALILRFTIAPTTFGTGRQIVLFLFFSAIFVALFLGVIYANRMTQLYVHRIREEAREEQELKIAAEIQQALLPPRIHNGKTFAAAAASIPCRTIGGDFFEYFDLPGDRLGFALGDVAGKGPPAAILASLVQGIFTSRVADDSGPAETLGRVNRALCQRGIDARFATIAYMVLTSDGKLVASSAGHNPAFLIGRDGGIRRLEKGGLLVGAFADAKYEEESLLLQADDTLVLFSDGVSDAESPNGEQFGEERLRALLLDAAKADPEQTLERVLQATTTFAAGRPPADDITVLVLQYLGRSGSRSKS